MDVVVVLVVILVLAIAIYSNMMWLAGILGVILVLVVMISGGKKTAKPAKAPEPQVPVPMGGGYPSWGEIKSLLVGAGETAGMVSKDWLASDKFRELTQDTIKEKVVKPIRESLGVKGSTKKTIFTIGGKDYEIDIDSVKNLQKEYGLNDEQITQMITRAFSSSYYWEPKKEE